MASTTTTPALADLHSSAASTTTAAATTTTTTTTPTTPIKLQVDTVTIPQLSKQLNIATIGCVHGELNKLYLACHEHQQKTGQEIHIIICCGDFESLRNHNDLQCLAAPPKYREMVDFYNYYNGNKTAPILTLFTHGNHEASNYLMELPYGGWVAPNIYFMGFTNVVKFFGVTIAAIGGIYKSSYKLPRHESCPLNESTTRSLYHTREIDTWMMQQYTKQIDIMFSHDWPADAPNQGDSRRLIEIKPLFEPDIRTNSLGSKFHTQLLRQLKPMYWFSAHLHCKFAALYKHDLTATTTPGTNTQNQFTKFLALDKILPGRHFMHVFPHTIPPTSAVHEVPITVAFITDLEAKANPIVSPNIKLLLNNLNYDQDWIQILQLSQPLYPRDKDPLTIKQPLQYSPTTHQQYYKQYSGQICDCITQSKSLQDLFVPHDTLHQQLYPDVKQIPSSTSLNIPNSTFVQTAKPLYEQQQRIYQISKYTGRPHQLQPKHFIRADIPDFMINPQTILFCNQFQLLIPVFFANCQWCSPKHAVELYNAQKAKLAASTAAATTTTTSTTQPTGTTTTVATPVPPTVATPVVSSTTTQ